MLFFSLSFAGLRSLIFPIDTSRRFREGCRARGAGWATGSYKGLPGLLVSREGTGEGRGDSENRKKRKARKTRLEEGGAFEGGGGKKGKKKKEAKNIERGKNMG